MPTISFNGLATGLDTDSIINSLVAVEKVPLTQLAAKKTSLSTAQSTMSSFLNDFAALRTAATALADPAGVDSLQATVSGSGFVATANGAANAGTYDIQVNHLASEQRTVSNVQASSTDAAGLSALTLTVAGGNAVDLGVQATDSITDIAAKINASGQRVNASVVYTGTGYALTVRGLDTGATNSFSFAETDGTLGLSTPANTYQAAQNSEIVIDGAITVQRSSNQVVGAISGVTLALTQETQSPAQLQVATDQNALVTKINALVSSYNAIVTAGHAASGYGTATASSPELSGDSAIRTSLNEISSVVSNDVPGLSGQYTSLASVGLNLTRDGLLELDSDKLSTVLQAQPDAVQKLFAGNAATGVAGIMDQLESTVSSLTDATDSVLQSRVDSMTALMTDIDNQSDTLQRQADDFETRLRTTFTNLEVEMSKIQADSRALSSLTGVTSSSSSTGTSTSTSSSGTSTT